MAKLTKEQSKNHNKAIDLLSKDTLTYDDKLFVYENYYESATNNNSISGAFFTPYGLARDFNLEILKNKKLVDLCAGIGMLSFVHYHSCERDGIPEITCIELNKEYYEIGKKLLPEANWILGSVLDKELIGSLPHFDQCISNPPFGNIKGNCSIDLKYKGSEFEFKVIEIGSMISDCGTFILPQQSTPFKYSGENMFIDYQLPNKNNGISSKVKKFIKETNFNFLFNVGIDTSYYLKEWKGVSPMCEIVTVDYKNIFNYE